jgi:hypothetical protein
MERARCLEEHIVLLVVNLTNGDSYVVNCQWQEQINRWLAAGGTKQFLLLSREVFASLLRACKSGGHKIKLIPVDTYFEQWQSNNNQNKSK